MDCRTAWLGVQPRYIRSLYQRYTVHERGFVFQVNFSLSKAYCRFRERLRGVLVFLFTSTVVGRRVLCAFIRMAGIVQWVSRRCLHQHLQFLLLSIIIGVAERGCYVCAMFVLFSAILGIWIFWCG